MATLIREVLPWPKSLGSVPPFSRQVFSDQDGARQKLKICSEPSGNKLSESVSKNYVHCL